MLRIFKRIFRLSFLIFIFVLLTGCIFKQAVEKLTVDQSEVITFVDEELTLIAKVLPLDAKQKVIWLSSDEKIATVEDGTITALSNGNVVITAIAGTKSVKVRVTVLNTDSKDLLEAMDDSNFLNYQVDLGVFMRVNGEYIDSKSKMFVHNNKMETQIDSEKIYTLILGDTVYVATHYSGDKWGVVTTEDPEGSNGIDEQLILSVADFSKVENYYSLKEDKAKEYAQLISDYMKFEAIVLQVENLIYKIKVTEGKIREIEIKFDCRFNITEGERSADVNLNLFMKMTFINYGNVIVDIPKEVMDEINIARKQH